MSGDHFLKSQKGLVRGSSWQENQLQALSPDDQNSRPVGCRLG